MSLRAVLFDLDGTLVDSLPTIAEAMSAAIRKHGFEVSAGAIRPLIGAPMNILAGEVTGASPEVANAINADYLALYHRDYIARTPPRPGARGLLDDLRAAGLLLGIVTNKNAEGGRLMLASQGWEPYFDLVHGRDDARAPKPSPEAALSALRSLGVAAADAAFVGDTEFDMRSARDAGVPLIVGVRGSRDEVRLRAEGATHVVGELAEIGPILLQPGVYR